MDGPSRRRFRIAVGRCQRCGREWPAHLDVCKNCAAAIGDPRPIDCERLTPPGVRGAVAPMLAVVMSIEIARHPPADDGWEQSTWERLAPALAGASQTRPGPAGTVIASWPLDRPDALVAVAEMALELHARLMISGGPLELRGAIGLGVVDAVERTPDVVRVVERLALAASPDRWLLAGEAGRRLREQFELRGVGLVPRWPIVPAGDYRALVGRLPAPVLPSAISGERPAVLVGRAAERQRLVSALTTAAAGRRQVVLIDAPAGTGKSYLLRYVLADPALPVNVAAGVAFPPLGARTLGPILGLAADCGAADLDPHSPTRLGAELAAAASARARTEPTALVVDDVHWADERSLAALRIAIDASDPDVPLAWILSARTAALTHLSELTDLVDTEVRLPPLAAADRVAILERALGTVSDELRAHVSAGAERGNALYLEHLAALLAETTGDVQLPGDLHGAVLARLDGLDARARALTAWTRRSRSPDRDLEALETELGDWLDRLETSDLATLDTISRYLSRLRAIDTELITARSLLGMPVTSNRRLAHTIERLAAASTGALLDYLGDLAAGGHPTEAADQALTAAWQAQHALRLADAEQLVAFACEHDERRVHPASLHGDLLLALGRPQEALAAYRRLAAPVEDVTLARRIARAAATAGHPRHAIAILERAAHATSAAAVEHDAVMLDLARVQGLRSLGDAPRSTTLRRRAVRTVAWSLAGESDAALAAANALVLDGAAAVAAAELIETAALGRLAGATVAGLSDAALRAADELGSPVARGLLDEDDATRARRTFLHADA